MTTIRDVAKLAEVSVATVSRVMNNQGYVSDAARRKVEKAITELNYKPNAIARSLYKKNSHSIGLIIPDITNPFFPQLIKSIEDTLGEEGYTVQLFNSEEKLERVLKIMDLMKSKYVAGAFIVSNTIREEHLRDFTLPVVGIDRVISDKIPTVSVNNYEGARTAVRHLIGKGCSKIAHIRGPEHIYTADERMRGYVDEMDEQRLQHYVIPGEYELKPSMQGTIKLLREYPEIEGIFAGNDVMAMGAIKAATQMGIAIPQQVKLIGFDGIEWGEAITPELTTMEQPIGEIGKKSAQLLLDLIDGKLNGSHHYKYDAKLIERKST